MYRVQHVVGLEVYNAKASNAMYSPFYIFIYFG